MSHRNSLLAVLGLSLLAVNGWGATITYTATSLGGTAWRYDYTVGNTTLGADLQEFTVHFALGQYANLAVGEVPADWDPLVAQPDPDIPGNGFVDLLALADGIAPGDSLGGFSVTFTYAGPGTPGPQAFDIVNPSPFATLESGFTTAVPLPAGLWLLGGALAAATRFRSRRH